MTCQPYTCPFPDPKETTERRWTCPSCQSHYRLTRPKPPRFWRNWSAPYGQWAEQHMPKVTK